MNEETEVLDTHTEDQVTETEISQEELDELKRRAEVSSQNFERAKKAEADKKALQDRIAELEASTTLGYTETNPQIEELTKRLNQIEEQKVLESVYAKFPAIVDKKTEFEEYRMQYPGVATESVAKLFVMEHGLDETPKRKGLEKGGTRKTPPESGKMTAEDVKRLRETNYKEYMNMLRAGKISIE